jgi:phosphatidylserine/phosphatidylglycerophosphate/cardiolipin synthase-like enzyme
VGRVRIASLACCLWLAACANLPPAADDANAPPPMGDDITNATALAAVVKSRDVMPLDTSSATPLMDQAVAELAKTDKGQRFRGITYDLTRDNSLGPHWLIQTPNIWGRRAASLVFMPLDCKGHCDPDFHLPLCRRNSDCGTGAVCGHLSAFDGLPALTAKRMCLGQADAVIDRFYQPIVGAQHAVDVTLLAPAPDVRFLSALRDAITELARSGRYVTVRLLVGQYPPNDVDTKGFLAELIRDAKMVPGSRIVIYVAAMRSCGGDITCQSYSWNHAKIVAVDGRVAVVGGHNMWTQDYLIDRPVHDISMQITGGAARDAHRFADKLWAYVCEHDDPLHVVSSYSYSAGKPGIMPGCLATIPLPPAASSKGSGIPVLAIGRLGSGMTSHFANQDDLARDLFFGAAQHSILVAQQDVAFSLPGQPVTLYPQETLAIWANFILSGRGDVYVVLSSDGAVGRSKSTYSNGIKIDEVANKLLDVAKAHSSLPQSALVELLCRHFHLAPFRFGPDASWPHKVPIGNHGKFWMVDNRYFYIGSDNLYPVDLQEFGYIVDSVPAAIDIRREYWDPLWRWSRRDAISGSDAPACVLRPKPTS